MKPNFLKLKEVKKLSKEDQKNVLGGFGVGWSNQWTGGSNEGNSTPVYGEPETPTTPGWKWRCYSPNSSSYYYSYTDLSHRGYTCYPI